MPTSKSEELASYLTLQQLHAVRSMRQAQKVYPRLAIISVGEESEVTSTLQQAAEDVAIEVEMHKVTAKDFKSSVQQCNENAAIQGIVVYGADADIAPAKDVMAVTGATTFENPQVKAQRWLEAAYSSVDTIEQFADSDPLLMAAVLDNLMQACRNN